VTSCPMDSDRTLAWQEVALRDLAVSKGTPIYPLQRGKTSPSTSGSDSNRGVAHHGTAPAQRPLPAISCQTTRTDRCPSSTGGRRY
jgi:hypothetical protein